MSGAKLRDRLRVVNLAFLSDLFNSRKNPPGAENSKAVAGNGLRHAGCMDHFVNA